jgi:hypothetical protein
MLVVLAWQLWTASAAINFNPFVNFHKEIPCPPQQAHWKATECAVSDQMCLNEHDMRVTALGILLGDVTQCWKAVTPARCADEVRLISTMPPSARTLLLDSWVNGYNKPTKENAK